MSVNDTEIDGTEDSRSRRPTRPADFVEAALYVVGICAVFGSGWLASKAAFALGISAVVQGGVF